MRLHDALFRSTSLNADKTAIAICGGLSLSFAELDRRSTSVAQFLMAEGVATGDRVGILSGHDAHALVLFWGILKASAVVVWLNEQIAVDSLCAVIREAEPVMVFVKGEKLLQDLEDRGNGLTRLVRLSEQAISAPKAGSVGALLPEGNAEDLAAIVYTSGSSGTPKGVCLSHENLLAVVNSVIAHMPISSADSYLMVVPIHYIHGMMQLLVHAIAGATVHFADSFVFPRKIVDLLRTTGASGFSGVPYHFNALVRRGGFLDAQLPDLKWLTVTGGKLPREQIAEIQRAMPDVAFHIAYGQTECAPRATALQPDRVRRKPDSVGAAIPGVDVLLFSDDGCEVARGEVGEVVVQGPNVMQGYWRDPAGTAQVLDSQGRLHTGDLGRFDEEGDLFLVGRKSAMIKSAGERIVPEELEKVLTGHPAVADAVVVGVDDSLYGQRVVAHILLSQEYHEADKERTIAEVRDHCLTQLPFVRAPREYHCWKEFPKKANGKTDRTLLQTMAAKDA